MHILFAGGGTAGHINPALAIAGYIKEKHPDAKISYVGTAKKLEATLVPRAGYDFYTIDVAGFSRKVTPKGIAHNISAVYKAATSSIKVRKILKNIKPDIVVGTGGYVSGPVLSAAQKLGIKTVIHEQNAYPGVTTKMLAKNADRVLLAYKEAEKYLNSKNGCIVTGNPVRGEIINADKKAAREKLGLDNRPLILSFGGSLGARPLNEAVTAFIKKHNGTHKYYHIHASGKNGYKAMKNALSDTPLSEEITLKDYIYDMDICMAAADIVISRAGAITLSEIQSLGKAAVLIPSPYVAENHQFHNAMSLKKAGAADIIEEKDLTDELFIKTVERLADNNSLLKAMSENAKKSAIIDANERIYREIMQLYNEIH